MGWSFRLIDLNLQSPAFSFNPTCKESLQVRHVAKYATTEKGNIMTPDKFKAIRTTLGLTQAQMALALRLNGSRAVRAYELGEREIGGPVSKLMDIFDRWPERKCQLFYGISESE